MTLRRFHKMHGLGNDFAIFDAREQPLRLAADQVRALADRHSGIGCDQLIVLHPSDRADVYMQIFNHDGSEVAACGNVTRCVVKLLGHDITIETAAGLLHGQLRDDDVRIDMGNPRFGHDEIPLAYAMDTAHMPVGWDDLADPFAVNVGNPHVIFFVPDANAVALHDIGPMIETDPLFPERVNVNVAHIVDGDVHLRVWERGAGLTLACGTGACATGIAAIARRLVTSPVTVHLPGGPLVIEWQAGGSVFMAGSAAYAFSGEIEIAA